MKRYVYVCIAHNTYWRVGQYLIVDEDKEYCMPGRPVPCGERGKFRVEAEGNIEIPFTSGMKAFCREVGAFTGHEGDEDAGQIILN